MSAVGNQMDEIETQALQAIPWIQNLDLESNLLRTTPALPDTLLHLSLADNRFENLPLTVANLENLGNIFRFDF
jgi:Leucine-rich repeat (LRR) protein